MINYIKSRKLLLLNDKRSQKLLKNIVFSFSAKIGNVLISLLLIPLTINYIHPLQYGLWITISSIISWISLFDLGLSNGLKNKLAIAISNNDLELAKKYISTAYATLTLISLVLFCTVLICNHLMNWRSFLNVPEVVSDDMNSLMLIVISVFLAQFIFQTINTILIASQRTADVTIISFIGQLIVIVVIYILKKNFPPNLTVIVCVFTIIPVLVLILSSVIYYNNSLKFIAPSFGKINKIYVKDILKLGGVFFVLQISFVLLFQTNSIVLAKLINQEAVTEYNVVYKLYSVITMILTIIITPYWSAFTEAYEKEDYKWMKKNLNILRRIWLMLFVLTIIVYIFSEIVMDIWIGKNMNLDKKLLIYMAVFIIVYNWMTIHNYFLNGIGKIRLQLYVTLFCAIVNVPLCVVLVKKLGIVGVIISNTFFFFLIGLIMYMQVEKIMHKSDKGIWTK